MISRVKKIEALFNFSAMAGPNPQFAFLTGYLIGQIDRVHFVEDLSGALISVRMSVRRAAVWPHVPFEAKVRGLTVPHAAAFVRSIAGENTPICVSLEFDTARWTAWYQEVLLPDASFVKDPAKAAEDRSEALWKEFGRTLDVYRECQQLLEKASPDRRKELSYYLGVAQGQMKELSRQMEDLHQYMKRAGEGEGEDKAPV